MQILTGTLLFCGFPIASAKKVVSFNVGTKAPRALTLGYSKRDLLSTSLVNLKNQYHISLRLGNPPQNASVVIDTGSADLWFVQPSNPYCAGASDSDVSPNDQVECSDGSFFNTADSSSWSDNSTEFSIQDADGIVAMGSYGQDDLSINGVKISKANFAVANMSNSTNGVFGIGPRYQEATVQLGSDGVATGIYDNIPIQMKQQGLISSVAYSLYMNHHNESSGTLLFGGVDHAKYKRNLGVVPILHYYPGNDTKLPEPAGVIVMFNGLSVQDNSGIRTWLADCAFPVVLDSGSTISYLPGVIIHAAAKAIGAKYSYSAHGYALPCKTSGSFVFNFSGVQVEVSIRNIVVPLSTANASALTDSDGNELCLLGMIDEFTYIYLDKTYTLGGSILKELYVVCDLENWEVGIAAADLESESEDIEEMTDRIPRGSSAPSYSSTAPTISYDTAEGSAVVITGLDSAINSTSEATVTGGQQPAMAGVSASSACVWLASILMILL